MLLSPDVLAILILDALFLFFALIALYVSVKIFFYYDASSTSPLQYKLEKQSYLAATLIKYILAFKIPLFLFFIFVLDKISNILTGAMCAAGVVDATEFGLYLLIVKVLNIYLFAFWLALHNEDIKEEKQSHVKLKFGMFIVLFVTLLTEIILEVSMFSAIEPSKMVSCCGTLFSTTSNSYVSDILLLDKTLILGLFYGVYTLLVVFYAMKNRYLFAVGNFFFIIVSIVSLISFFGTYIYELPTHHCPFCLLQSEYHYVGYFLYTFLFLGTFFGLESGFRNESTKEYKLSLLFNSLYVALVSYYVGAYYLKNGVWLS